MSSNSIVVVLLLVACRGASVAPPCESVADCLPGEFCQRGACASALSNCSMQTDCAADEVCRALLDGGTSCWPRARLCLHTADCGAGAACVNGFCETDFTPCSGPAECPGGLICDREGYCRAPNSPCDGARCEAGFECRERPDQPQARGQCLPSRCASPCPSGLVCVGSECVAPGCVFVSCAAGTVCTSLWSVNPRHAQCTPTCATVICNAGEERRCPTANADPATCSIKDAGTAAEDGGCGITIVCIQGAFWSGGDKPYEAGQQRSCGGTCPVMLNQTCRADGTWSACQ